MAVIATIALLLSASQAVGTEPEEIEILEVLSSVEPEVLENVAQVTPEITADSALVVQTEVSNATIPTDPTDPLLIESQTGAAVGIELPFAEQAHDAEAVDEGIVEFDNLNDSHSVPVVKDDGSVQITTIIETANAPEDYSYKVTLPDGAVAQQVEGGGVLFLSAEGDFLGGLTPPWAKDANGIDVPTSYEIDGTTITQVVQHREASEVAYPVVADPWAGVDLFGYTGYNRKGTYLGQVVVSAKLSGWGWYWYGTGGGIAIVANAGWSELLKKRPQADDKASIRQQYTCHVVFGYAVWLAGLHWDLEKARPNKSNWMDTALSHKCNW